MSGWCRLEKIGTYAFVGMVWYNTIPVAIFVPNVRFRRGQIRASRAASSSYTATNPRNLHNPRRNSGRFWGRVGRIFQVLFLLVSSWREKTQGRRIFQASQDFCAVLWRWWHVRKRTAQFLLAIRLLQNVTCRLNVAVIQVEIQNPPISLTAASPSP